MPRIKLKPDNLNERNAEKGIERLFASFSDRSVARVSRCIVQNNQLPTFADQAHEPGLRTRPDLAR